MNLVSYSRVSTDEQRQQGHSLGVQAQAHATCAALHGHVIVEAIADEGVSASRPLERRPGGAAVLDALREGRAQGVIVSRLDRLFRDALDGLQFFRDAGDAGWAVHSVSELIDTSTPQGKLALTIMLGTAAYERDMAVVRSAEVSRALQRQGRAWGHTPFGFTRDAAGTLSRDPVTWPQRELIVRLRQVDGLSWRALCRALRDHNIPNPAGRRVWSESTVRGIVESHHAVEHIDADGADNEAQVSPAGVAGAGHCARTQETLA